ncbi:EAL domain-containing protein [Altererythrobacter sp. KTW20L]|uniref:EAL domain-containing protein n=1 Tax=Altererythrobacter sp. KTW20L TaxID=2942210 RepID=UPI0020BEC480|nr:EAL domain-containing protein [Altererythrobacter sp. KTW20L]MCL6251377.1 EAL domain-containing protein [Altererythrobacter sp. KTW20L]
MSSTRTSAETAAERRLRHDRRAAVEHPLAADLAAAIAAGTVEVLFQPQYGCETGGITGAEALARWHHPDRGTVAGDELFRIAARSGLVRVLSDHVMDRALTVACDWPKDLRLSLNITAGDLATPGFPDVVAAALCRTGFAPERLTLEITEQALVLELDRSAERLGQLVDLGIKVALDDFGAGFCNFRYLKKLPLHYLKLDRSMIEGIADDRRDLEVLRGIVALASALDLAVIAEGVETKAQRDAVVREGCASWQGYLGARAVPAADFAALVAA